MPINSTLKHNITKMPDSEYKDILDAHLGKSFTLDELIEASLLSSDRFNKVYSSDSELKKLFTDFNKKLDANKLMEKGILSKERYDRIYYISPEERYHQHLQNIVDGKYTDEEILSLIKKGEIQKIDLIREEIMTDLDINRLFPEVQIDSGIYDLTGVPDILPENRIDVFVFGIASSGKSSFLSGLLFYANREGKLNNLNISPKGHQYVNLLIKAVEDKKAMPRTPVEYINYLACNFMHENPDQSVDENPFSFIEMSGELFKTCYESGIDKMNDKLKNYLFSKNNKVFIFVIDYDVHNSNLHLNISQRDHFTAMLQLLWQNGALSKAYSLCILITKWDLRANNSQSPDEFLKDKNYLSFVNLCKKYMGELKKQGCRIVFEIKTYSLGRFSGKKYEYNQTDSEMLFNWLSDYSPIINKPVETKPSIFGKLFGK